MQINRIIDGKVVYLTEEEIVQLVEEQNQQLVEISKHLIKQELIESFPTLEEKVNAILTQLYYINKAEDIPLSDAMKKLFARYDLITGNKKYKDLKDVIAENVFEKQEVSASHKTEKKIFMEKMETRFNEVQAMAEEAKASNTEVTKALKEINEGLEAIKGFLMLIPDMQKALLDVKDVLKNK